MNTLLFITSGYFWSNIGGKLLILEDIYPFMRRMLLGTTLLLLVIATGCSKKKSINGTVLVNVMLRDTVRPNATVYMKGNITNDTLLNFAAYDATITTNSIGQAVFTDLSAGRYYFIAVDTTKNQLNVGERFVTVETPLVDPKISGGNRYEALIRLD